jgi:hypothetical protein
MSEQDAGRFVGALAASLCIAAVVAAVYAALGALFLRSVAGRVGKLQLSYGQAYVTTLLPSLAAYLVSIAMVFLVPRDVLRRDQLYLTGMAALTSIWFVAQWAAIRVRHKTDGTLAAEIT